MKKLLLILLPISIFLVSCGGGEGDLQPVDPIDPPTLSLEETLVGKKWSLSNEDEDGFILSPGGGFFTTKKCTPHDWEGSWFFEGNLIKYSYTQNSIQTTVLWGEVTEYSATEVKILEESSSTLTTEKVYYITEDDKYGCMDPLASNYDSIATCDNQNCQYAKTYVPDDNLENFLENRGDGDDIYSNDSVFTSRIEEIMTLSLINLNISDLTGIEDFSSLRELYCQNNQLSNITLNNSNLEKLNCSFNQITNLDLSNLTKLEDLHCYNNQIQSINVTSSLKYLWCYYNGLSNIDLSSATSLQTLRCQYNNISSLDLSNASSIRTLICRDNNISNIDLTNNINLNEIDISTNQISSLDLSYNTSLTTIICENINQLATLNISGLNLLKDIFSPNCQITNLDLSNKPNLETIICSGNQITGNWDLTASINLISLYCGANQISSLNISGLTKLKNLSCGGNLISDIDINGMDDLEYLVLSQNNISSFLNFDNKTKLWMCHVSNNQLTGYLDLSDASSLTSFECQNNLISNLNLNNGNNGASQPINTLNNPNLSCIKVDQVSNQWGPSLNGQIDPHHYFSEYCP
jgi:Leucine-rich repeat (LRR) protein